MIFSIIVHLQSQFGLERAPVDATSPGGLFSRRFFFLFTHPPCDNSKFKPARTYSSENSGCACASQGVHVRSNWSTYYLRLATTYPSVIPPSAASPAGRWLLAVNLAGQLVDQIFNYDANIETIIMFRTATPRIPNPISSMSSPARWRPILHHFRLCIAIPPRLAPFRPKRHPWRVTACLAFAPSSS